jgi:4-diphosphocytidyl-2-C-methyl-D-erythritol kinase
MWPTTAEPPAIDSAARLEAAPAKVNLALHVTGRRADGYHALDTLVVFAAIGDTVRADAGSRGVALAVEGPFAEALEHATPAGENLVVRAALALAGSGHRPAPLLITLDKRLPVAAGLGGGSADAAATLRLLRRIWRLAIPAEELARLGRRLGADVPLCLRSSPLRVSGAEERVAPVGGMPALSMVLVNPGIPVSTASVFARRQGEWDQPLPALPARFGSVFELAIWLRQTRNGLYDAALAENRRIARAVKALEADPDCILARMSGSGATAFGLFASEAAAQRAAIRLRVARPEWWVAATRTGASPPGAAP